MLEAKVGIGDEFWMFCRICLAFTSVPGGVGYRGRLWR